MKVALAQNSAQKPSPAWRAGHCTTTPKKDKRGHKTGAPRMSRLVQSSVSAKSNLFFPLLTVAVKPDVSGLLYRLGVM